MSKRNGDNDTQARKRVQRVAGLRKFFATAVWQIDTASEVHPANVIEGIVQQFGTSKALAGLRQAANDTIGETSHWNSEARAVVDEACRAAGVVTLSEITRRYSASYMRIVKRGFIKSETEYYVVNGILLDQGSAISDDERRLLQRMTEAFEQKA